MGTVVEQNAPRRTWFWVLIAILAASGIFMAFTVFFGWVGTDAFSVAGYVFLADVYLIASMAAQHVWLKRAIWVGTGVSFALSIAMVFVPYQQYYPERSGPFSEGRSLYGFFSDLEFALHMLTVALIVLGLFSLTYRFVRETGFLRTVYVLTFALALIASVLFATELVTLVDEFGMPWGVGVAILALTGAAIGVIGALVQRKAVQQPQTGEDRVPADVLPEEEARAESGDRVTLSRSELEQLVRRIVDERMADRDGE